MWAREPLDRSGLLNEAAGMVRIIEAAPASYAVRRWLRSLQNRSKRVHWFAAESEAGGRTLEYEQEARKRGWRT